MKRGQRDLEKLFGKEGGPARSRAGWALTAWGPAAPRAPPRASRGPSFRVQTLATCGRGSGFNLEARVSPDHAWRFKGKFSLRGNSREDSAGGRGDHQPVRPQRLPGSNARDAGRRWALGEMRVDLSSCALGKRLEKDRSAARHAPSSPYSQPRFSGTSARWTPTPESSRWGAGCQRPGQSQSSRSAWPQPLPILGSPRLPSCVRVSFLTQRLAMGCRGLSVRAWL